MKHGTVICVLITLIAGEAAASDAILAISGSVGVFRSDMRVFNPSYTKDIQVQAYLLPAGNIDNTGVQPTTILVPKRQMVVYDDVVASLFHGGGLAAIRLKSDDDFAATQRIYADTGGGTLGQFLHAVDIAAAKRQGLMLQLKISAAFRTNIGVVNPSAAPATVTWRVYGRTNAAVGNGRTDTLQPFAVIAPQSVAAYFNTGAADLSDGWISFTSDRPIIAYASVVDNATTDPTYVEMLEDVGETFQTDWNTFVDGIDACFKTTSCRAETTVNICSCVTAAYERQTVSWEGIYEGVNASAPTSVVIRMPARTVTAPKGSGTVTVVTPILLQSLTSGQLADWSTVPPGTAVRFRTTLGIIRLLGTGYAGSGPPILLFTTSGGDRLP